MKRFSIPALVVFIAGTVRLASASVANFGPTNQTMTLTGLGADSSGRGQVRVTWGTCKYDGTNTTCTVTAAFSGVGPGGTISSVLTYSGNGLSPFTGVSQAPGSDFIFGTLTSGTLVTTLTESNGTVLTFEGLAPFFQYSQPGDGRRNARAFRNAAWDKWD